MVDDETPEGRRRRTLRAAEALADDQEGVLSRRQLYALGVTRWQVKAQLLARRWQRTGRQSVAVTTGKLSDKARRRVAVFETGPRAALDGVTALQEAGLKTITEPVLHVIAPKSSEPRRSPGVRVHESRRFREADVLTNGVRRVKPAVAAVHAALWAVSDRQAVLFVVAAVQQRLARVENVADALTEVRRHRRRRLLLRVVRDIAGGAHALRELDFAGALRKRGLPEPSRQTIVERRGRRAYLDVDWEEWAVSLELDGEQHEDASARLEDVLRDLDVAATGRTTLRLPLWAMSVDEEAVLDGLEAVLRSRGWRPAGEEPEAA